MNEKRAALAEKFGADTVVNPKEQPLAAAIGKLFGPGEPYCILECSGNAAALQETIGIAPLGCRIAMVGMASAPVTFIPMVVFQKPLTIVGCFGNTQAECRECMDIMSSGGMPAGELITKRVGIDGLPAAFDELMESKDQIKIVMDLL